MNKNGFGINNLPNQTVKLKENQTKVEYQNFARELKKLWNMKVMKIPIVIGALGTVTKGLVKRAGGNENKSMSGDCPNYSTVKIGENTEKSPEETCCHSDSSEIPSANIASNFSIK